MVGRFKPLVPCPKCGRVRVEPARVCTQCWKAANDEQRASLANAGYRGSSDRRPDERNRRRDRKAA